MSKDDELRAKAAALAPKKQGKKKVRDSSLSETPTTSTLQEGLNPTPQTPPGGEPCKRSQPPQLAAAQHKAGRPPKAEKADLDEKHLEELQGALSKLSKKALRKLNTLLDDTNARVQMQAALGTIRSTVQALTRDTSSPGGGAEIHIHTSQAVAVVNPCSPGGQAQPPNPHDQMQRQKAIGHPIAIVK